MPEKLPGTEKLRPGVIIVGSVTADLTTFSQRLPSRGETIHGDEFTLVLGGKGANQAVAVGLAGADAHFVACVGTDLFQNLIFDGLRSAGVATEHVRAIDGARTGIAHIRVDDSAENDIVMVPLANEQLSVEQIDQAFAACSATSSVLLTQLEIPADLSSYAIRRARESGLTVILDPAPAVPLDDSIWAGIDIVTPNETEARILTGIEVTDQESATKAGRWFLDRGAKAAVITLAAAGALLVTNDEITAFPAIPVISVDTTAAGDSFAGYLGAGIALGMPLHDAIRLAGAAGALTVTKRGASPSLPERRDVEALMSTNAIPANPSERN
ncbi:ribokinase [Salinibacterium sp. NK8237]|uniref:ribokinase n=1 Tax=Salinibacterium sp. NK8237 TaxID=2792038 RepID=UPI0018CE4CC7|nr:ribokinase [Salinibacterium sp. NK8237]MBH0130187.1 ribokinase [Salinibacterium sp. NK8237]